jgi:tartrate dehydratase alpha subunit/fumarate hydratase class I-like protein
MDEIEKLKEENEDLKSKLIDLTFEMNYNKQDELIEFIRNLYESLNPKELKKCSKKEIITNLKYAIEEFARNNRIALK